MNQHKECMSVWGDCISPLKCYNVTTVSHSTSCLQIHHPHDYSQSTPEIHRMNTRRKTKSSRSLRKGQKTGSKRSTKWKKQKMKYQHTTCSKSNLCKEFDKVTKQTKIPAKMTRSDWDKMGTTYMASTILHQLLNSLRGCDGNHFRRPACPLRAANSRRDGFSELMDALTANLPPGLSSYMETSRVPTSKVY